MARGLTPLAITNLKPKAQRYEHRDKGSLGLYLVVQPSGTKSWAVRYRYDGQPRKLTLGPLFQPQDGEQEPAAPTVGQPLTLAGARKLAASALHQLQSGIDPAADKRNVASTAAQKAAQRKADSVEALAKVFLKRYAQEQTRESTWREYARILGLKPDPEQPKEWVKTGSGVLAEWGGRSVHDIKRRDVIDLLDGIVDRDAPFVANRTLAVVRKWFNWLVARDVIPASPCVGISPPGAETKRDRVLTDDEITSLWQATEKVGWPFGPLARMLLLTGQRRDEVGEMRWSEVDLDAKAWVIPRARMKGDSEHAVPLSDQAVKVLRSLPRVVGPKGYVFSTNGETPVGGYSRAKARIDVLMERAANGLPLEAGRRRKAGSKKADKKQQVKVPPWRFHDLRRTAATGMARLGIALPVIEKVLAHSSGSFAGIVGVYQRHGFEDEKRVALVEWGRFIERLVSGEADNVVALRGRKKRAK